MLLSEQPCLGTCGSQIQHPVKSYHPGFAGFTRDAFLVMNEADIVSNAIFDALRCAEGARSPNKRDLQGTKLNSFSFIG